MVKIRQGKYERLGSRYIRRLGIAGLVIGFIVIIFSGIFFLTGTANKTHSLLMVGNPMLVMFWYPENDQVFLIKIPADLYLDAVHGVGPYSLRSLWRLGIIEKKYRTLLIDSLSEVLGLPVEEYLGSKNEDISETASDETPVKHLKTAWGSIETGKFLGNYYSTNISLVDFIRLKWKISLLKTKMVENIDLSGDNAVITQELPDKTKIKILQTDKIDQIFGNNLEITQIRQDKQSVAIINTTLTAGLGQNVSRTLNHLGILVVSIDSEDSALRECLLSGNKTALKSLTADFITFIYHCSLKVDEGPSTANLTLRIGTDYAAFSMPVSP